MNKHNIVKLFEYKEDKGKVNFEQDCYQMLDNSIQKILEAQVSVRNLKNYMEATVISGKTTQSFHNKLVNQLDLMFMEAWASIKVKGD